jgi:hypothetical protein
MPTKKSESRLPKRGAKKAKGKGAKPAEDADVAELEAADLGAKDEDGDNVVELRPKDKPTSGRKQQLIPGTEPPHFEEIDAAATHYHSIKCQRAALSTDEREARAMLLEVMRKHDVSVYRFEDEGRSFVARIKAGDDKAEVKEADGGEREDEDEGAA